MYADKRSPFISYAQNGEDIVLHRALGHITDGRYVDVGSADPVDDSVSFAFYERGWRGVHIEPVPALASALRKVRPDDRVFEVAAGRSRARSELFVAAGTGRSTLLEEIAVASEADGLELQKIEVEVLRLDHILAEAGLAGRDIHFLKIDVEGAEADVLAGCDLSQWRPWVLIVEATNPQSTAQTHAAWEPGIIEHGYKFAMFDGLNRFYVANEHADLLPSLSYPVCVFDQPYLRADVASRIETLAEELAHANETATATALAAKNADMLVGELSGAVETRDKLLAEAAAKAHDDGVTAHELHTATSAARRDAMEWRNAALDTLDELADLDRRRQAAVEHAQLLRDQLTRVERYVNAIESTVSWRITRPIRSARRMQRSHREDATTESFPAVTAPISRAEHSGVPRLDDSVSRSLVERLLAAAETLHPSITASRSPAESVAEALSTLETAVEAAPEQPEAIAWLVFVAVVARYPDELELERAARRLRTDGVRLLLLDLRQQLQDRVRAGADVQRGLAVVQSDVLVDVGHTVAHDLHTGIQRVVRETVSRWLTTHKPIALCSFDFAELHPVLLADGEAERLVRWQDHIHQSGTDVVRRVPQLRSPDVVVPWHATLILPELVAEPERCGAYRTMARAGVIRRLGIIGFDCIPITAAETVTDGMAANFSNYLTVVKYAHTLSAISEATAREFTAFGEMVRSQGLRGPRVAAHPLPAHRPPRVERDLEHTRRSVGLDSLPLVLVVGSHEPRKNHLRVLEAAERLWRSGSAFHLLFIGGSGWRGEAFDELVDQLRAQGRSLRVWRRPSEAELWASYQLARFSIFPSIVEGYGLPIAESLACGTPVITSNYGSMAEVAAGGGALTVDPREVQALSNAMQRMLDDDALVAELTQQALSRSWPTWDGYAAAVWSHLTETIVAGNGSSKP